MTGGFFVGAVCDRAPFLPEPHNSAGIGRMRGHRPRLQAICNYLETGLPNFAASIATFVLISFSLAVYLPSSHEN